ncbi:MAG: hypothetical protein R3E76_14520 [Planctomycetota bacterium]
MRYILVVAVLISVGCSTSRIHRVASGTATKSPESVPHSGTQLHDVTTSEPFDVVKHGHPTTYEHNALYWSMTSVGSTNGETFRLPQAINEIRVGHRFEVWRDGEFLTTADVIEADELIVECRIHEGEVRQGDTVLSVLWRPDRKLRVALHGSFDADDAPMQRADLVTALEAYGCEVWQRAEPGIDLVVLGSRLLSDEWYRRARNDLRFGTIRDDLVVDYFLPPK